MELTRRQKFEEYMHTVRMLGVQRFPTGSHEREIIDEGIALMREMMEGYPVFDDSRETTKEAIERKCNEFLKEMGNAGIGVSIKVIYEE